MTKLSLRCIKENKLLTNMVFTIFLFLVLMATQVLFNIIGHQDYFLSLQSSKTIYSLLIFSFLLSFLKNKALFTTQAIFTLFIFFQSVHMQYYHIYIFPQEITTAFKDNRELISILPEVSLFILKALCLSLGFLFFNLVILKTFKNRKVIPYMGWLIIIILIIHMITLFLSNSRVGSRPSSNHSLYDNSINTVTYYLSEQLPIDIGLKKSYVKSYNHEPYKIQTENPKINIVFLQGESLTFHHMSLYGYHRKTTPFLDKLNAEKKIFFRKGVPSGTMTDVSIPSFYNMIEKPDGVQQILNGKTNLFRMATANGFRTHFISVQSTYGLGYIKPYIGVRYIDTYKDSHDFGSSLGSSGFDKSLIHYLKNTNLNKPNFIVLHQHACHTTYSSNYPPQFTVFGSTHETFKEHEVNTYDNCVLYVDNTYREIYTYLEKHSTLPTYFIFDSDHGEGLGEQNDFFGHGNMNIRNVINIPVIITGFHGANLTFLKQIEKQPNPNWVSHFELSKIVAYLLGYKTGAIFDQSQKYIVNGYKLNGTQGFRTINAKTLN